MKNKKGFTIIELMAVIVIMGILMGVAVPAATKYIKKAKKNSYEAMEESSYLAAQNYIVDTGKIIKRSGYTIQIQDLVDKQYLDPLIDPDKKDNSTCGGTVVVNVKKGSGNALDVYEYVVNLHCSSYSRTKKFTS